MLEKSLEAISTPKIFTIAAFWNLPCNASLDNNSWFAIAKFAVFTLEWLKPENVFCLVLKWPKSLHANPSMCTALFEIAETLSIGILTKIICFSNFLGFSSSSSNISIFSIYSGSNDNENFSTCWAFEKTDFFLFVFISIFNPL